MKLLYFCRKACIPCVVVTKILSQYKHIQIEVIDVDAHPEIAEKFAIYSVPTVLFLNKNKVIEQHTSPKNIEKAIRMHYAV